MEAAVKGHAYAKAPIDIACWDVFGKATGMRVADLLGGAFREEIPLYTGIAIAAPDEMRQRAANAVANGYRHVQLKVGTGWREDVARVEACLEVLEETERVIVDANGYWTQAEAVRAVAALDGTPVAVEQPCATIEECRAVRARSRLPFVLDESLVDLAALERARDAADAVRLKLSQLGGITPMRRARDLAAAWGLQMTLEDSGGGDVVTAAMAHLSASVPPRLLLAGFLVGIAVLSVLYWTLTRDLKLPRAIVVYALSFNALVMIVKFIIAPDAIYEVNKKVAFTGFFNVGDPIGTAAAAVLVLLLYVFVYWLVYSRFRIKVLGRRALKLRDLIISKRKSLLIMLGGVVLMAMAGGGFVLLIPLVGVVSGAQYLEFVFSSAASLVIALTLAGATVLAHMAFRGAAERAVLVGDVALFVSFFWVGLAFLALYHVLWVVYVLVLTSIWPLKVVVPK
jgi:hypothetical protein